MPAEEMRLAAELSHALAEADAWRIRQAVRAYREWADQDESQPGMQPASGGTAGAGEETTG
jgi:hypothetical protein